MIDPEKALKDRLKEDRKRQKLKMKLDKKLQSGKINYKTYSRELKKMGYVSKKDLLEDFRSAIREEIERLESIDSEEGANGAPPPPPSDMRSMYGNDLMDGPLRPEQTEEQPREAEEPGEHEDRGDEPDDFDELTEDMADWDFGESKDDEYTDEDDDEGEYEDEEEEEEEEEEGDRPFVDVVKVDRRSGVVDYSEIKQMDFSDVKVMDSYDQAAEIGKSKKKRRKKRKGKPRKAPADEDIDKKGVSKIEEPELSEAEKLIMEMEAEPEEQLDLEEVFIPDVASTLKSKESEVSRRKGATDIMWEADGKDEEWLRKRFREEAKDLARRRRKWFAQKRAAAEALKTADRAPDGTEIEEWALTKILHETILVREGGKLRKQPREIWKVKPMRKRSDRDGKPQEGAGDENKKPRGESKSTEIDWD